MTESFLVYAPGLLFLLAMNLIVALALAIKIKNKRIAILVSVLSTTAALKTIAVIQIGYFDVTFLLLLLGGGLVTSILVNEAVEKFEARTVRTLADP